MKFLITRAEPHASQLAAALNAKAISTEAVPVMSIAPVELSGAARSRLMNLDLYDSVIVISANAAELLAAHLDQYWPQLPVGIEWVAIGQATANMLASELGELSSDQIHVPDGTDSEALMQLPVFQQVSGAKVLLVKGEGGRDVIHQTLSERGASVTELVLYQRQPAMEFAEQLVQVFRQQPQFVQIASGDSFLNLLAMLEGHLDRGSVVSSDAYWLVPSDRVADLLHSHQVRKEKVLVCNGASNQAILARIQELL
ncbi:uroporphyrinogen-III synthase [Litoribrevibacter albus]|uniref:Uroporphyrinogen-III synthase n=1 Tax=Litoribrevibacter albus TaxID=1473156 RepID=A0AA37SDL7_9GAMM|nr:uroporphyrinogen-III synthase [Litoribrevibacter albus]GLQ33065.1 uroporphyrinogen III methyltransferase [Litoribrevibacter albus]